MQIRAVKAADPHERGAEPNCPVGWCIMPQEGVDVPIPILIPTHSSQSCSEAEEDQKWSREMGTESWTASGFVVFYFPASEL